MFKKLQTLFMDIGAKMVVDLSIFNMLSLTLSYDEFKNRFSQTDRAKQFL